MPAPVRVAVALGSNLGDRRAHLTWAIEHLSEFLSVLRVSSFHDTTPVDVLEPQPRYLNAAVTGTTMLQARELLDRLLALELQRGRERAAYHSARTLDLDLILYGDRQLHEPGLVVPHPRFREREFVLAPLAEIAADWKDPVSGLSVGELLAQKKTGLPR